MKGIIGIAAKKEILLTFGYKVFFILNSTGHFVCFVALHPKSKAMVMAERSVHLTLGPNKHGLVTYIQVNVYIGNTLLWLNGG